MSVDKKAAGSGAFHVDLEKIRLQIRRWQEKVLDLTKSNPLLGLNRSRVAKLRVTTPESAELFAQFVIRETELRMPLARKKRSINPSTDESETPLIENPDEQEEKVRVEPGDLEFEASPLELMRRLRRIYDNARTTVEERGVTTLHLTFGALHWRDELFGESVSPLWMVPCELESKGPDAPLRLTIADEEMQLNPALEYCLRERHEVELPDVPDEATEISLQSFLTATQKAVREYGWRVTDEVWLSTFTFESLVIYRDLKAMTELAGQNRVVSSLARATVLAGQSEALPDDLDSVFHPENSPIPILPTDSSQLEALTCAASGRNVVVHGPPGTGKSQTITNLIADALGRNQKALFVSAKMAALNVVHERLKGLGLERFCLEAHSTKAGKMKIIDALRRTLEAEAGKQDGALQEELQGLLKLRNELNGYVRELHTRNEPLGLSIYQTIGKLAKLHKAPDIRAPLPEIDALAIGRQRFDDCTDTLTQLGTMDRVFDSRTTHPWRGFTSEKIGLDAQEKIETALKQLGESAKSMLAYLDLLSAVIPENHQLTIVQLEQFAAALEALAAGERLPSNWWIRSSEELGALASIFETACALALEFATKEDQLRAYISLPFHEAAAVLSLIDTKFQAWYSLLSPPLWRWRSELKRVCKPGAGLDKKTIRANSAIARRLVEVQRWSSGASIPSGRTQQCRKQSL